MKAERVNLREVRYMFNEECYKKLTEKGCLGKYGRNCYIGFSCFYLASCFIAVLLLMFFERFSWVFPIIIALGLVIINVIMSRQLKKEPYLCDYAEIVSVDKAYATVKIGDTKVKASSFEKFLKNENLDSYAPGDKVIVFSPDKRMSRPLFTKAD